jgi:hypothetical protein
MTPVQAIAMLDDEEGTFLDKLRKLLVILNHIDIPGETRRSVPRCACGCELSVWYGRASGHTLVWHPLGACTCPRAGFRSSGKTPEEAMHTYVETAPDLDTLDTIPEAEDPVSDPDDFSSEFS